MMQKIKNVLHFMRINYRRFLLVFYNVIYYIIFQQLEHRVIAHNILSTEVDQLIPFCEVFVIPYFMWFGYVTFGIIITIFQKQGEDFYLMGTNLFIGMTLFLIISYVYPNGLNLRPDPIPRNNIFCKLVALLYASDTPTNVFPSIHVFNSLAVTTAIDKLSIIRKHKKVRVSFWLLMVLIILSTMFIKQHSVLDVIGAFVLFAVLYPFVYGKLSKPVRAFWKRIYDPKHYSANYDLEWFGQ